MIFMEAKAIWGWVLIAAVIVVGAAAV